MCIYISREFIFWKLGSPLEMCFYRVQKDSELRISTVFYLRTILAQYCMVVEIKPIQVLAWVNVKSNAPKAYKQHSSFYTFL